MKILRSAASSLHISSGSSSSSVENRRSRQDTDATPRAVPRTRSKVKARIVDDDDAKSAKKRQGKEKGNGKIHDRRVRAQGRSMGGGREDRRARFGDSVRSPAAGLFK